MILIVSDEPTLLYSRAAMLREWPCDTANLADAPYVVRTRRYDLIIFCQTVPESLAMELFTIARMLNESVKMLRMVRAGSESGASYQAEHYIVDLAHPGRLRYVVANLLATPELVEQ